MSTIAPVVPLFLTAEDGVLVTFDVNGGKALRDGVEDVVHAAAPIRGPRLDGGSSEDERAAIARLRKQGEWNRPSSTDFVSGTVSGAVIDENKRCQATAVVTSLCERGAAGAAACGGRKSMLMSGGAMDPIARANAELLDSSETPEPMSTDVCPKAELRAVAGSHQSRTIAVRAPFVSSQLEAAKACVGLMGHLSWIAHVWLLLDVCAVVRECGMKEVGYRPSSADKAASAESVQSPTAMIAVPLSVYDVSSMAHRMPASEPRLDVD